MSANYNPRKIQFALKYKFLIGIVSITTTSSPEEVVKRKGRRLPMFLVVGRKLRARCGLKATARETLRTATRHSATNGANGFRLRIIFSLTRVPLF
jgi:hypothetical protein